MKILITDKMAEEAIQLLKDAGHDVKFDEMDHDTLLKEIEKYDALMVRGRTKVVKEIVNAGSKGSLKVIGRAGIGVDNVDIETAGKLGIPVVNAPTGSTISVAELTITHMLSLSRNIAKADNTMKKGEWAKKQLRGSELYGKTLGLIGTGNIGKLTGKIAKCFGMKIIGFDPFISKEDMMKDGIEKREDLGNLISSSDFISLHLPHTPKTHYIVNKDMISKMKPSAYIINCSRGGTVDEEALFNALKNGKIAGAGIDVFEKEPPQNNPLLTLENVILTPHLGANTNEGQIRAGTICAEQIIKVLEGKEPDYCVNKKYLQ
ncbi:MAG: phosphoglycerate dehydrogenase [Thermoplasmatales archaeon SG8-52-3]|nr:MAG: phosphoglycerate dehydrogenase [Thermoplasmatales archaeon SG8-52-3]